VHSAENECDFTAFFHQPRAGERLPMCFRAGIHLMVAGADFYYAAPAKEMIAEPIFVLATPTFNDYLKDVV
jgi:hypothetical protein